MRVEHEAVGAFDAGQQRLALRGEARGRAVGAVDVQPHVVALRELGQFGQRVDRARARRAGRRDDRERVEARGAIAVDRGLDRGGIEPVARIGLEHAQVRGVEAEDAPGLRHRRVRVLGDVAGGSRAVGVASLGRGRERGQRAERAAAHEHALGRLRHAHPAAQPVEHRELERGRAGATGPAAGEDVVAGPDQVAEHGDGVARAAHAGEEPRVVGTLAAGQDRVEELVDRGLWIARVVRARGDTALRPAGVGGSDRRLLVERLPAVHEPVPDVMTEAAQLVGRQAQRVHGGDNRAMRAAVMRSFGEPLVIEEVPDPPCPDDGVVLRVLASGVCRSDWHGWMGHDPSIALPHVGGHELCGEIAAAGPLVAGWSVGDRVTVPFCCGCGVCSPCRQGETQLCERDFQPGFTAWGSFAEFVALPRADLNLVAVPAGLSDVEAASLGCRFMTAWAALHVHAGVRAGEWVAVHGCGGVGLAAVMIAAAAGARVVAVDIDEAKLERAVSFGAEAAVSADVVEAIRSLTAAAPTSPSTRSAVHRRA